MKKKDFKVELIRIIACLAVLCYHVRRLPFKADGTLSETAVFFESVCTICVMSFFLISGFYIYNKNNSIIIDWGLLLVSFFKKIFPPFLISVIVSLIFHDYFLSVKSISECIFNFNISNIFSNIFASFKNLNVNNLPGTCGHLWYVYAYFFIILYYPFTRFILKKIPKFLTYAILILFTVLMFANDYFLFYNKPIINGFFDIIKKPVIYSAIGCILYNDYIKKILFKFRINIMIFSFMVYTLTFILLYKTQVSYYLTTNGPYVYTSWLSSYSLILTSAFIIFIYNFDFENLFSTKIRNIIYFLSDRTYLIYIIHYFIITKLYSLGFQGIFFNNLNNFFEHVIYHIFYTIFIFVVTLLFVLLIEYIYKATNKFFRRHIWLKEKTI